MPIYTALHVLCLRPGNAHESYPTTYHLPADYLAEGSPAKGIIINQLIYANQVATHGAPQDDVTYPYSVFFDGNNGNHIIENVVALDLITDLPAACTWIEQICDAGYAPHTHKLLVTGNALVKLIYPNF